jgi:hypothetical protein
VSKHGREWSQKETFFGWKMRGAKVTNLKTVLGSSPDKDIGFMNHFYFDIQRCVSNDQACDKISGNCG